MHPNAGGAFITHERQLPWINGIVAGGHGLHACSGLETAESSMLQRTLHERASNFSPDIQHAGLLHWFVSPYVHTLRVDRASGNIEATRLNLFARPVTTRFRVEDAQFANTHRPQVTFKVGVKF